LLDQDVIARGAIDFVRRVAAAGRAHVLHVEGVFEREHDAVHRHFLEVGIAPVLRVQRSGGFQRVGQMPEIFADRRRAFRQRPERRMPVEVALAGDRALAADVQRRQRVHLARIRDAGDHAILLLDRRIGCRLLHAAEFERPAFIFVEIRKEVGGRQRFGWELHRGPAAHRAVRRRDIGAVLRHELARNAVECTHARKIVLDDFDAGRLAAADRVVQFRDRGFFELEGHSVVSFRPLTRSGP
jgi:hypothetical protein